MRHPPRHGFRREQAYYAKPGNRFWRTLHEVGLTPRLFAPEEYRLLLPLGIGLTDLANPSAGQDATLAVDELHVDRLRASLERHRPQCLAFTSKNAAQLALGRRNLRFGQQDEPFCGIETHVLPSTSGWPHPTGTLRRGRPLPGA